VVAPDEPGLLGALIGQRGDLSGVKALLAEGGIVERPPADLREAARRHGFRPSQVRRLLMVRELARRWHIPPDSAAPPVTSPREALLQFQDLRRSLKECFSVLYLNTRNQPVGCEKVAIGGLNVAALQPRESLRPGADPGGRRRHPGSQPSLGRPDPQPRGSGGNPPSPGGWPATWCGSA
jgi:DNA repair protein RadC